ncbi:hypothetical protein [Salinibius halmophilus]|uniref:hypothetical protein n=1 Tax=Salinibius halmophilus TaxID=1853216 RepID=UPI000E665FF5|nr:hypothetical protein [Salinibius halmophilus]
MIGESESLVYGLIVDEPDSDPDYLATARRHNRQVIQSLGFEDGFPAIISTQFSVHGGMQGFGTHQPQLIHFSMSYPGVEYYWQTWLKKFESVLAQLYWTSARVQLETELSGKHCFSWTSDQTRHLPNQGIVIATCEWAHDII